MQKLCRYGAFIAPLLFLNVTSTTTYAVAVSGQGTWETTLQGRDLDGIAATYEAYYDTALDITWLADANYALTSGTDVDGVINGLMTWAGANYWASILDINGITGWRLPAVGPINGSTFDINVSNNATTDAGWADDNSWIDGSGNPVSEMGYMYYVTLGDLGFCAPEDANPGSCTQPIDWGLSNTGPFSNIQSSQYYWSETGYDPNYAWNFKFNDGLQSLGGTTGGLLYAWAVHDGDVGTAVVPVPTALWLFYSGLLSIIGIARVKKAT
jgi:hypothetical protein